MGVIVNRMMRMYTITYHKPKPSGRKSNRYLGSCMRGVLENVWNIYIQSNRVINIGLD